MYDYSKLRGKIREVFGTQEAFAKAMGLSTTTISDKLNNKLQWTQKEMDRAIDLLKIDASELPVYFYTKSSAS